MQQNSEKFTFWGLAVLSALLIVGILIVLIGSVAKLVIRNTGGEIRSFPEQIVERVKPIGRLNDGVVAKVVDKTETPKEIVDRLCSTCHATGLNGAPIMGEQAAWMERFDKQGFEGLKKSALTGFNNGLMPAKGGDPSLSDDEVIGALIYQLKASDLEEKLKEAGIDTNI